MKSHCFLSLTLTVILLWSFRLVGNAQQPAAKAEITRSMDASAEMWNRGDLNGYMELYAPHATMMTKNGRVGLDSIRGLYVKYYFVDGKPKQQLAYDNYEITMLGSNYALVTGRFILKANDRLPERTGSFSLVFIHGKNGWKILHDHSG